MRFLTFVRAKLSTVCLALAVCMTLMIISGSSIAVPGFLEQKVNTVSFLNDRVRDITGASAVNAPGFIVPDGLSGEGQIVAIADSGLDTGRLEDMHPDLTSPAEEMPKIISLKSLAGREVPDDPDGHGTHMAATIAGTGAASNGQFRGVAPGASIYFQSILNEDGKPEPPGDLADLFRPAYLAGARIHVDGWGSGLNNYGEAASRVDDFVYSHPDFLAIFGAGNSGPAQRTITTEANSKNALTVGSSILPRPAFVPGTDVTTTPADFSSRGPASDGRIKPELLAPGSAVISARSSLIEGNLQGYPFYTRMQGTSMAAAVAGGSAALLREYLETSPSQNTPSAALIKALLINGARPLTGGPSIEGFGVVDLAGTVIALRGGAFQYADEWQGLSQNGAKTYSFHVADGTAPFKATLAWSDPPAEPGSTRSLVNDLDLIVTAPDGKTYYGNHFLGGSTPDRTNNIEQVYLPSPVLGDYTIRVYGQSVQGEIQPGMVAIQDFALAWGQPPAESVVEETGTLVKLSNGQEFDPGKVDIKNLVNDSLENASRIYNGAQVYQTARRVYLTARLWLATGVRMLKVPDGTIFTEINPAARLGGYRLAPDQDVLLNKNPIGQGSLPPGVEVNAVINPLDQRIRQVHADYVELEGIVSALYKDKGKTTIRLAENFSKAYKISDDAVYSFNDTYEGSETADIPFGAGSLEVLEKPLPGLTVRLHLAPSTGEIQYLSIKRRVVLGTVAETTSIPGQIKMENGEVFQIPPSAQVIKDGVSSRYDQIKQGDSISAVLLPDTGTLIGVVAYSNVLYGGAIGITQKDKKFYLLDDSDKYLSLDITQKATFYRWGVKVTSNAVSSGNLVKVATSPDGSEVWRVDIAEDFDAREIVAGYDPVKGIITSKEGNEYSVTRRTRFYKNGYPVQLEDILPGENIVLRYTLTPISAAKVLVSANANSTQTPPLLLASVIPLQEQLMVTGTTDPGTVLELWRKGQTVQEVPVNELGQFNIYLPGESGGESFMLVAVNRGTGGTLGIQLSSPNLEGAAAPANPGGWNNTFDGNISRAESAVMLSRILNWSGGDQLPLTFMDTAEIPATARQAVAEASARGIFTGYPDGSFRPAHYLSRAEAAVVLASVMCELGQKLVAGPILNYKDSDDIPVWAIKAVAETTAAGFLKSNADVFSPNLPVTVKEMASNLNYLIELCSKKFASQSEE